jgi:hypothetical protein
MIGKPCEANCPLQEIRSQNKLARWSRLYLNYYRSMTRQSWREWNFFVLNRNTTYRNIIFSKSI